MSKAKCIVYVLTVLFIITSCGPVKKLDRLHNKYPYLFEKAMDTVQIKDTVNVTVPGMKMDTVFNVKHLIDTVVMHKDHIRTTIYQKADTVYVSTVADTIIKRVPYEKKVAVQTYKAEVHTKPFPWKLLIIGIIIVLVLVFGSKIVSKFLK